MHSKLRMSLELNFILLIFLTNTGKMFLNIFWMNIRKDALLILTFYVIKELNLKHSLTTPKILVQLRSQLVTMQESARKMENTFLRLVSMATKIKATFFICLIKNSCHKVCFLLEKLINKRFEILQEITTLLLQRKKTQRAYVL